MHREIDTMQNVEIYKVNAHGLIDFYHQQHQTQEPADKYANSMAFLRQCEKPSVKSAHFIFPQPAAGPYPTGYAA